ncbi:MAG: hypothetical protein IT318_01250 [Anaerolineales bacterium]|nr:hypothetical protein [Anaerolineales bacterium]
MAPDSSWMNSFLADRAARRASQPGVRPGQAATRPASSASQAPPPPKRPVPPASSARAAQPASGFTPPSASRPTPAASTPARLHAPTPAQPRTPTPPAALGPACLRMALAAGLAWSLPAAAGAWRGGLPPGALVLLYWSLLALTVAAFAATAGAVHWLATQMGAAGSRARLALACARFAAPLTVLAGLALAGPAGLRLALLPLAATGLVLTALAVRAVYQLEWRWALVAALPAAALLAGVPLAAVAGVWAGLA